MNLPSWNIYYVIELSIFGKFFLIPVFASPHSTTATQSIRYHPEKRKSITKSFPSRFSSASVYATDLRPTK
jgi:hypothetical protein